MLTHSTLDRLEELRLVGMARALREQMNTPDIDGLDFLERLGLLVEREWTEKENRRLESRLRRASLREQATMEDLDYRGGRVGDRGSPLDRQLMNQLASCDWVRRHHNVVITGPTGVGKSYLACALAHKACLYGYSARYHRLSRLLEDVAIARGDGRYLKLLKTLSKVDVLVIDDWGLAQLTEVQQRDLLELLDDRYGARSTIATSQLPVANWHEAMANPTLADAVMDRLVHNAYRIELRGDSMRRGRTDLHDCVQSLT
jgi:DNA replication protein DnaC